MSYHLLTTDWTRQLGTGSRRGGGYRSIAIFQGDTRSEVLSLGRELGGRCLRAEREAAGGRRKDVGLRRREGEGFRRA